MAGKKSGKIVTQNRVEEIISLLLLGYQRYEIVESKSKEWKCTAANIDHYISLAKDKWADHWSKEVADDLKSRHNFLYKKALMTGNIKEARANLESVARISGFNKDKTEHTGTINLNEIKTIVINTDEANDINEKEE